MKGYKQLLEEGVEAEPGALQVFMNVRSLNTIVSNVARLVPGIVEGMGLELDTTLNLPGFDL